MADKEWSSFDDRAYLADDDQLLVKAAGGAGVNVPGAALVKKDANGSVRGTGIVFLTTTTTGYGFQLYLGDANFDDPGYRTAAPGIGAVQNASGAGVAGELALYSYNGSSARVERMRITNFGYAGIGTTNPALRLVVSRDGNEGIEFQLGVEASLPANTVGLQCYNRLTSSYNAFRVYANGHSFYNGGSVVARIDTSGFMGIGTAGPLSKLHVANSDDTECKIIAGNPSGYAAIGARPSGNGAFIEAYSSQPISFGTYDLAATRREYGRFDGSGNLLVGVTHTAHALYKDVPEGGEILIIGAPGKNPIRFFATIGTGYSASAASMIVTTNSTTGRSINAGGTINASGADYAEYMVKSTNCREIAKGDVCGLDANGQLVTSWAAAIRCVVKSTDPAYVGGDRYSDGMAQRPEAPVEPVLASYQEPAIDVEPIGDEPNADAPEHAEWASRKKAHDGAVAQATRNRDTANRARQRDVAKHERAHAKWQAAMDRHATATIAWEAELERRRATVDRIAFCGQAPVNVSPAVLEAVRSGLNAGVAIYLVGVQGDDDSIRATAFGAGEMTLPLYMARLGRALRVDGDQVIIDVQHG